MEYYQSKVGKLADLREIGETNRTTLIGDNTILELNFMGGSKRSSSEDQYTSTVRSYS